MNCVIFGGGISGLLAYHILKHYGHTATILEAQKQLSGDFFAGGLKYIPDTAATRWFVREVLKADFETVHVQGGILWGQSIWTSWENLASSPVRAGLSSVSGNKLAVAIRSSHYLKTRHQLPASQHQVDFARCMNEQSLSAQTLQVERGLVLKVVDIPVEDVHFETAVMKYGLDEKGERFVAVLRQAGSYKQMEMEPGTVLFTTLPSGTEHGWLTCLGFETTVDPLLSLGIDYVYTPVTPYQLIHRISSLRVGAMGDTRHWQAEISWPDKQSGREFVSLVANSGSLVADLVACELAAIQPTGFTLKAVTLIKGHLWEVEPDELDVDLGMMEQFGIIRLGRYAEWDSRADVSSVIEKVRGICEKASDS